MGFLAVRASLSILSSSVLNSMSGKVMRHTIIIPVLIVASTLGHTHAQSVSAGQAIFKAQCAICHSVQPGETIVGPSLAGVVGRGAGQMEGFEYSQATKESGLTWDRETLERYLASPREVVPKSKMPYAGLKDAAKRADLLAYLATLK
jgi:cytochrome c